jgi:hypothetical protein
MAASFDWTFGSRFAYNYVTARGGQSEPRRKTMASKKSTKKLKKPRPLQHTKPLSHIKKAVLT